MKAHPENRFDFIDRMNHQLLENPAYGERLCDAVRKGNQEGVTCFFVHANDQKKLNFDTVLSSMALEIGLSDKVETWWIGGDLTGKFPPEKSKLAVDAIHTFLERHFRDSHTQSMRKDRLLVSEYAGPEDAEGTSFSAIRCIGKAIEESPDISGNFIPYVVSDTDATKWFQSIGSVIHPDIRQLYIVHGQRDGESDPWDSNGLAKNGLILEGGSRTLGYIFDIVGQGGQVIGIHGLRANNEILSAVLFMTEFQLFLKNKPNVSKEEIDQYWNEYIRNVPPFDKSASDAHTKQAFIDKAWNDFHEKDLRQSVIENFKGFHVDQYLSPEINTSKWQQAIVQQRKELQQNLAFPL